MDATRLLKSQLIADTGLLLLHALDRSQSKVQPRFKGRKKSLSLLMGEWDAQFFGEIVSDHLWKQCTIITFSRR